MTPTDDTSEPRVTLNPKDERDTHLPYDTSNPRWRKKARWVVDYFRPRSRLVNELARLRDEIEAYRVGSAIEAKAGDECRAAYEKLRAALLTADDLLYKERTKNAILATVAEKHAGGNLEIFDQLRKERDLATEALERIAEGSSHVAPIARAALGKIKGDR